MAQIAAELGLSDPCAWLGELIAEEEGKVGCIIMSMSQDDVDTVMRLPYAAVISDSLYGGGDSLTRGCMDRSPKFFVNT